MLSNSPRTSNEPQGPSGACQNRSGGNGTPQVTACGCGSGAVTVTYDGILLDPDQVRTRLTLSDAQMSAAVNISMGATMTATLRKLDGRTRADDRADARKAARVRKILRDSAIRILRKRGMSIRAIAADLAVGIGTVQRALAPGAVHRTNALRAYYKATGKRIPSARIAEIRDILRGEREGRGGRA